MTAVRHKHTRLRTSHNVLIQSVCNPNSLLIQAPQTDIQGVYIYEQVDDPEGNEQTGV